jgi:MFS family permease
VVSRLAGHLSGRFGIGPVAFVGTLAFAAGPTWWLTHLGVTPDYLVGMLPGQLLTGLGVGLILPTLSSVVGSALPAPRWGSGSSLINTARQVGSVLGVALLVSVIGAHTTGLPSEFGSVRAGWGLLAGAALVAAVLAVGLSVVERRQVVTALGEPAVVIDVEDGVTAEPAATTEPRSDVAVDALADVRVGAGLRGAVVRGVVRDGRGLPVPGAITTVIDAAGAQLGRAQADPGGRFAMTLEYARTSPGEHVIVLVSAPGHHPRARRVPAAGGPALELALVRRDTVAA